MDKVRVGIIGCGGIANNKHMPSLSKLEDVELVAFCDIILDRAQKAAAEYGAPGSAVYQDYHELLKDESIQVVHVLTPNIDHSPITCDALRAGKDVMCEKPMAINSREAQKMLDAARETGRKLTIGYQGRFRPTAMYLKQICDAGELGEIYYARAKALRRRGVPTWGVFIDEEKQGGGPLIDIGTHALDLTLWCMNNYEPEMVVGSRYRKLADTRNAANAFGPWDPEKFTTEDSCFGFVRMKNGATISVESSWAINLLDIGESKTILCGTLAGADMDGDTKLNGGVRINGERHSRMYTEYPELKAGGVDFFAGKSDRPDEVEARMWIDHVKDSTKPLITKPEQAFVVTQILEAIYASAASGQPVYF